MFLNNYKANVLQWYDKNKLFVNFFYVVKYSKRCIVVFYKKIGYLKEIPQTEARGILPFFVGRNSNYIGMANIWINIDYLLHFQPNNQAKNFRLIFQS